MVTAKMVDAEDYATITRESAAIRALFQSVRGQ
jgi:hypothetical protein